MKEWTEDEVKYLKESYPSNVPIEEICEELKRTYDSVMDKKRSLFLKRNEKTKKQNKELLSSIDLSSVEECSFFIEKHKSLMQDKLWMTFNG